MTAKPGFVIITHGDLGRELLRVARYIIGEPLTNFAVVKTPFMGEITPVPAAAAPFRDRRHRILEELHRAAEQVDQGAGLVILSDLFGGTSFQIAQELLRQRPGAVVAGVNLPMLIKAAQLNGNSTITPAGIAADLTERSRQAIVCR